jgi:hypothetical protein
MKKKGVKFCKKVMKSMFNHYSFWVMIIGCNLILIIKSNFLYTKRRQNHELQQNRQQVT